MKILACALSIGLFAACGGGDGGSSHGDTPANELTDAEHIEVCEDFNDTIDSDDIAGQAGLICLIGESFQPPCDQARLDQCVEDAIADYMAEACTAPEADDPIRDCEATVDEIWACSEAQMDQYHELADAQCSDLENEDPFPVPAACEALMEKCPELFQDDQA